jgi:hypothetical protein
MDSSCSANNCCPEAPDITINNTVIESDGLAARTRQEVLGTAWNFVGATITLLYTPIAAASVNVFVNGVLQRLTVDYTLSGKVITFVTMPPANAVVQVVYISSDV